MQKSAPAWTVSMITSAVIGLLLIVTGIFVTWLAIQFMFEARRLDWGNVFLILIVSLPLWLGAGLLSYSLGWETLKNVFFILALISFVIGVIAGIYLVSSL